MATIATPALSPAERARTIIATASSVQIGVLNMTSEISRHAVDADGSVLFAPDPGSPERVFAVARHLPPPTMNLTALDVAPAAQPDRLRGSLSISGRLSAVREPLPAGVRAHLAWPHGRGEETVLRLEPTKVGVAWPRRATGVDRRATVDVSAEDYRAAAPDPLLEHEGPWLEHLRRDHPGAIRALAEHALDQSGDERLGPSEVTYPLAVDRHGIMVRVYRDRGPTDVRLPFERSMRCACEAHEVFAELMFRIRPDAPDLDCSG